MFSSSQILAQTPALRLRHLTIEQGLSQNSAQCLLQDRRGFLWVGTQDGLNRFDGYTFRVFRSQPGNSASICGNWIQALIEDSTGKLWIGTPSGLSCYHPDIEQFTSYKNDPGNPKSICGNDIRSIFEDPSGKLWIGTRDKGICCLDRSTGETVPLPGSLVAAGLAGKPVRTLFLDPNGNLWIALQGTQLWCLTLATGQLEPFHQRPEWKAALGTTDIFVIQVTQDGILWVGTQGNGLVRHNLTNHQLTTYRTDPQNPKSLGSNDVLCVYQKRDQSCWIGTRGGGLCRYQPESDDFIQYKRNPSRSDALQSNDIWTMFEDASGIFWIGTDSGGLAAYDQHMDRFTTYRNHPLQPASLPSNNVRALLQDRSGTLWVGTNGGGLSRFVPDTEEFISFRPDKANPTSISSEAVFSLLESRSGSLWVGTRSGGLCELDRKTDRFTRFQNDPADPTSLSNNTVWSLCEDHTGIIWVGTNGGGLNRFDPATKRFTTYKLDPNRPGSLTSNDVFTLFEDRSQTLWVGLRGGGLCRYDREHDSFTAFKNDPTNPKSLSNNSVRSIAQDRAGTLWVGTNGGLNRFDPTTGTFEIFREAEGLPNDTIYGILEDQAGHLWMSTNHGLSRFDPQTRKFRNFDVSDGLQSNEFNWNAWCRQSNGSLLFGGVGGFTRFQPATIQELSYVPPVVLTAFKVFNQPVSLQQSITTTPELVMSYTDTMITFEFAALSFSQSNRNQYAYKLEGFDRDWIQAGTKHDATYTNLDGGRYVLRIRAANCDGVWNEQGVTLRIKVIPPPWKRWWAIGLYILGISGTGYGLFRMQVNRLKVKSRLHEAQLTTEAAQAKALAAEIQTKAIEAENRQRAEAEAAIKKKNEELAAALEKMRRLQAETERQNRELIASHQQADRIFSALAEALPGTILDGKYRLDEKIGAGGFGAVFQATHLILNRPIAVKVFRPSPGNDSAEAVERFQREGISTSLLSHPNAVQVFDSGISSDGIAYLVMELLRGHSLAAELQTRQRILPRRSLRLMLSVCEALTEAHKLGIVHRDIKPENIFLNQTSDGEIVKVVDFGIAKMLGEDSDGSLAKLTATGGIIGTPTYMAPERLAGKSYDGRSDVYSVGVMLYELLSGRTPFQTEEKSVIGLIMAHIQEAPPPLETIHPELPPEITALVNRLLAKDPDQRPTAQELAHRLRELLVTLDLDENDPGMIRQITGSLAELPTYQFQGLLDASPITQENFPAHSTVDTIHTISENLRLSERETIITPAGLPGVEPDQSQE